MQPLMEIASWTGVGKRFGVDEKKMMLPNAKSSPQKPTAPVAARQAPGQRSPSLKKRNATEDPGCLGLTSTLSSLTEVHS